MHTNRKILMGVLALALPAGTLAAFSPSAFAAKPPPNPVNCTFSAAVSISPPLSVAGVVSAKGDLGTTVINATYSGCTTASGPVAGFSQTLTISTKSSKDANYKTDGNSKTGWYLGLCSGFTSAKGSKATLKGLKKAVNNLPVGGGLLKGSKASEGSIGADVGFIVNHGTVKGGSYPTATHAADIMAGLTNDANNTNLIGGCTAGPVDHIDIDSSSSSASL